MMIQTEAGTATCIGGAPVLAESRRFMVKLAENEFEVAQAQRLRYEVFKLEQGRMPGLTSRLDRDCFDDRCAHLLVIERTGGRVVGTYRMCSGRGLNSVRDLYTSQEFEIRGLASRLPRCFEVGRSCVAPEYRSGAVVAMLWSGIAEVRRREKFDYMLGCVSLENTDCDFGWSLYRELMAAGRVSSEIFARPRPEFAAPAAKRIVAVDLARDLPPLFKGYLRIGGVVCGPPALDRDFGAIDFMIWFDFNGLPDKYARHFNV